MEKAREHAAELIFIIQKYERRKGILDPSDPQSGYKCNDYSTVTNDADRKVFQQLATQQINMAETIHRYQ